MIIQKTQASDFDNIIKLWGNGDVMHYVGFPNGYETSTEALSSWLNRIQSSAFLEHYSIYSDNEYCGEVFYRLIENNEAEIDIKLMPTCWGKGIGRDALSFIVDEVLQTTSATTCLVNPNPDNKAAVQCYLACGFVFEGRDDNVYKVNWSSFKPSKNHLETNLSLNSIKADQTQRLWTLMAKEEDYQWAHFNAPYFNEFVQMDYATFLEKEAPYYIEKEAQIGIYYREVLIGTASYYWENKQTRWMETGFVICDASYWNKGIASIVATRMYNMCFESFEIERIGFTSWSGNPGMIHVGKKLGMREEKRVRNARYYKETYYDSIGYGITRNEWQVLQNKRYDYRYVNKPEKRSALCREILEDLPNWFGIPESIDEYCAEVSAMMCLVVYDGLRPIGFMALNPDRGETLEIHVMGIREAYQGNGIGRRLIMEAQIYASRNEVNYLMVRTLSEDHPDPFYKKTRLFYRSLGFVGVGVDRLVWGEHTPCLTMLKHINY